MAKKQTPEAWIGQQVRVGLVTTQQTRAGVGPGGESEPSGKLTGRNEDGIVLLQRVEEGERHVFYPWSFVAWVYPIEEQGAEEKPSPQVPFGPTQPSPLEGLY